MGGHLVWDQAILRNIRGSIPCIPTTAVSTGSNPVDSTIRGYGCNGKHRLSMPLLSSG